MKFENLIKVSLAILFVAYTGCGKTTTPTAATEATGVADLTQLPSLSGAVTSGSSSHLTNSEDYLNKSTTGTKLSAFSGLDWNTHSGGLCRVGEMYGHLLSQAVGADRTKCYIGVMQKYGIFSDLGAEGRDVTYTIGQGGHDAGVVKFHTTKNSAGEFTGFRMYDCMGQSTTEQGGYIDYKISSTGLEVTNVYSGGGSSGGYTSTMKGRATITGTIGADHNWTSKSVTAINVGSFSMTGVAMSQTQKMIATETVSGLSFRGYMSGSYTVTGQSAVATTGAFSTFLDLIHATDGTIANIAIGDGSVKGTMTAAGVAYPQSNMSWTGDTGMALATAADGAHYAEALALTDLTAADIATATTDVAFATAEKFDCSTTGATAINLTTAFAANAAAAAAFEACEDYRDPNETAPINCNTNH